MKNMRSNFYELIISLIKKMNKMQKMNELLKIRDSINVLIMRLSNKPINSRGVVDYDYTIEKINECFLLAKQFGMYKLIKVIFNDMLDFSQSLRMESSMLPEIETDY